MNGASHKAIRKTIMNHQMLVLLSKRHDGVNPIFSQHVLALELLRLSVSKLITEEIIAVLPSHSQFRLQNNLYLDLHGLVFETSIYHWQDQPGSDCSIVVLFPTCRQYAYYNVVVPPHFQQFGSDHFACARWDRSNRSFYNLGSYRNRSRFGEDMQ